MKSLTIMLLVSIVNLIHAQPPEKALDSLQLKGVDYFTTDQYGSLYLISFNRLIKLDENRKEVFSYSNPLLGNINSISAFNPLHLLLFYEDQQQITTLDNRLNENSQLKFTDLDLKDVQLVSQSDENNIWVYEQSTDKLYRINLSSNRITNQTLNITQLLNTENKPIQLESTIDKVYLNLPEKGILVFDATGALNRTIPVKNIRSFTIGNHEIFYLKERGVFRYDLLKNQEKPLKTSVDKGKSIALSETTLFLLESSWLKIYSIL